PPPRPAGPRAGPPRGGLGGGAPPGGGVSRPGPPPPAGAPLAWEGRRQCRIAIPGAAKPLDRLLLPCTKP
ncbi:hypothetical protein ACUNGS_16035, partial [Serratia sp. IR-2025]